MSRSNLNIQKVLQLMRKQIEKEWGKSSFEYAKHLEWDKHIKIKKS